MANTILKVCLEISLITNVLLFSGGFGEIVNLCSDGTGTRETNRPIYENQGGEYVFTSTGCSTSNPSALVLKFNSRINCIPYGRCEGNSYFQVNDEDVFSTCNGAKKCYIFATGNGVLDELSRPGCNSYASHVYNQFPNVVLKYTTCLNTIEFSYDYIVKEPDPTTTTIPKTSVITTKSSTTQASTLSSTTSKTYSVITSGAATTQYTASTNASAECPDKASRSFPMERSLAIVFGALLLVTLLALIGLAIRYHRLVSTKYGSADGNSEKREVIVNQAYESFHDQESGGETVVNELYGSQ